MKLARRYFLICALLVASHYLHAQQTEEQFNVPVNYLLALPDGYQQDTLKKWPLIIFLHGSGESGDDLKKVKVHGPPKLIEQGKKFPFIIISPQAKIGMGWRPELLQIWLTDFRKQYRVDPDRIYLTGLSMGGFGTWNWAAKFPKQFAAIAPICGGGDTAEAAKFKNLPVWCFHGGKDNTVNPELSRSMVAAVKKYNSDVRLTIYPEAGHDSWTETYNNDSLYTWFLAHKKYSLKSIALSESALKDYAGSYAIKAGRDTLKLELENSKLVLHDGGQTIEFLPTAANSFFINEGDTQSEVKFFRNKKNKIEKLVYYGDRPIEFIKLD